MNKDADKAHKYQVASALLMIVAAPVILVGNLLAWPFLTVYDKLKGKKHD